MTNTLFWDIESHDAELIWDMDPDEFFRLGQFSWNRDKKIELTDSRKELIKQIRKADCVVAHNQHHFDLTAVFGKDSTEPLQMAHDRKVFDTMVHATLVNQAPPKFQNRAGHTFYTEKNVGAVQKWFGLDQQCFALHLEGKIGDLKALAKKYGGFGLIPLDDPEFTAYAEQDVHAVRELAIRLKMMGGRDFSWRYAWREQMLWAIDAQNSRNGFTVDRATAQARYDELQAERDETMQMLVENYNFPTEGKQPWRSAAGKQAIFDALADAGITPETRPDWKKTDKGNLSLGGEAVLELTEGTSVEDLGRGLATLLGQRSLAELALKSQKSDGKAHPKITRFQTSGRTSVTEPGLTVWTARGPGAVEKRYFTASPGRKLVELDYSNCFLPDAKALTSDMRWVSVRDLSVGDELIGFDEQLDYRTSKMRRTTVTHVAETTQTTVTLVMSNGDRLTTSPGHKWPLKYGNEKRAWVEARDIVKGAQLTKWAGEPWTEEQTFEAGWIAGMYDGEGWVSASQPADRTGTTNVGIAQKKGPVLDRVMEWLTNQDYVYSHHTNGSSVEVLCVSRTDSKMRLLGSLRPTRLLEKHPYVWENRRPWNPSTPTYEVVEVVHEETPTGLISVGTTTHTLVVDGYLTHNCDARIVAALSGDEKYAERFEPGADGHEINGRAVYGDELYDSDPKFYRQQAKLQGHAWAYRVGPKGLAKQTGLPEATTKHFITTMNETYHQVVRWQNRASNDGEYGFVINEWGRVLKVNPERSYTQAPALLGQSGTREIVADALIRIYEAKPEVITWLVAQVHDALVWDIPEDALDWAVPFIKEHMEDVVEPKDGSGQRIEFPVEAGEPSDNWFLCSHA